MCYRELQCIEYSCGHKEPFTESKVDCNSSRCRYSAQHVRGCLACSSTCSQMSVGQCSIQFEELN
ncbi:hypothetical protein HYDPIDRAFT_95166 [Hydnomerulius pinastri MD-312]|uniref:Unplaced genomic scaffold scaffold_23, whole genome shotgun sequence n=1 Tax=Hydnomerulius pinastri MD-312 TaxID=994086 RepID=A0A0C9V8Q4_9AGAM|nr:hypothetical protein HYDPIDRAFT_95166 [Hydnomerulius pinastri MD-312]